MTTRVKGRSLPLLVGLLAALFTVACPTTAGAAPASYFPLPGGKANTIEGLTVATDGTLWVAQTLSTGPANPERHMRFLHVSLSGALLAATPEQEGDPIFTEVVPAADGGIWANTFAGVEHIAPDGSVQIIKGPEAGGLSLVAGRDGRAWMQHCDASSLSGVHEEHCVALAIAIDGEVTTYALPGLSDTWPPGATSAGGAFHSVATESGIWFWKLFRIGEAPPVASAEFISYQGIGTPIGDVPTQSFLVAPATGDSVWWLHNELLAGATIGRLDPTGQISDTHHMGNLSRLPEFPDPFGADPGRNGSLVWAQNATWNDTSDGQIGIAGLDGSNTGFLVEHNATAVPTSTPNFWSGSCTFGVRMFQAADGSLWTISGGHPPRLTRQQLNGGFSTFLLDGSSEFAGEEESSVWGMDESSPHELWFMLNTPHGPELARLDPLDPPPPEPRMPESEPGSWSRAKPSRHRRPGERRAVSRLLKSAIVQIRAQLKHPAHAGHRFSLKLNFTLPGTLQIKVGRHSGAHTVALAVAKRHAAVGPLTMLIPFRPALRHLLRAPSRRTTVSISARFRHPKSPAVTRRSSMHLSSASAPARKLARTERALAVVRPRLATRRGGVIAVEGSDGVAGFEVRVDGRELPRNLASSRHYFGKPASRRYVGYKRDPECQLRWPGQRVTANFYHGYGGVFRGSCAPAAGTLRVEFGAGWTTDTGVEVGSSVADMRRAYPDATRHGSVWGLIESYPPWEVTIDVLAARVRAGRVVSLSVAGPEAWDE